MIANKSNLAKPFEDVFPLSEKYLNSYIALHNKEDYWTGERVSESLDKFDVYVAVKEEKVVGYIDIINNNQNNKVFDLFVVDDYRKIGYGKKLLKTGLANSTSEQIELEVDVDNTAALHLYNIMEFKKNKSNTITAKLVSSSV